jgi:hypothetical protein
MSRMCVVSYGFTTIPGTCCAEKYEPVRLEACHITNGFCFQVNGEAFALVVVLVVVPLLLPLFAADLFGYFLCEGFGLCAGKAVGAAFLVDFVNQCIAGFFGFFLRRVNFFFRNLLLPCLIR